MLVDRQRIGDFTVGNPKNKFIFSTNWKIGRFDTTLRLTRYGEAVSTASVAAGGAAFDETVCAALIVDLDTTFARHRPAGRDGGRQQPVQHLSGRRHSGQPGRHGLHGYYNQYSPFGTSGGFYYTRLTYQF